MMFISSIKHPDYMLYLIVHLQDLLTKQERQTTTHLSLTLTSRPFSSLNVVQVFSSLSRARRSSAF